MKAILVINEMPKNCDKCPIRFSGDPNEWCWFLKHGLDDIQSKPSWCPLRPFPRMSGLVHPDVDGWCKLSDYSRGWNDCLEEIEK